MTPAATIREAAADGVRLALTPAGTVKAIGDQVAVNRWLPVLREHKAEIVALLARDGAPPDLPGVSPELAARLSAEDLREFFEERSAILEYDAGLPRPEAEIEAARITATYARNRGYLWASLRSALADYPVLLVSRPVGSIAARGRRCA